ncbi:MULTISPECIES: hypothetical protein [Pirellulaceae]|uniref:hypothetical protein n=1 Tax=Pirellulaceae TaxID=2691357 RepID=UPI0011B00DF5|nr:MULTISPECIES: hypothetical protein [Pirellulaceae]
MIDEVRQGDARELAGRFEGPVEFLLIDRGYTNDHPCFQASEMKLVPGVVVVADNVGLGAFGMENYLPHVWAEYQSKSEWFDIDLPWGIQDPVEITIIQSKGGNK